MYSGGVTFMEAPVRFILRSLLVLISLYALVFAIGDAYLMHSQAPIWVGALFVVVLVGVQYLIAPWWIEWVFAIDWYEDALPARHRAFIEETCRKQGLPMLQIGLIESGTPNAFAFGRLRSDARIVVTRGLLDNLNEDEVNAVLAHEIGHVAHYDFAVMALAAMAPLMLWQIYIWSDRVNNLRVVSCAAYVAYYVAQFMVLLLNRTREYGADHFSAHVTGQPCQLSSALVKIGYGMVRERSAAQERVAKGDSTAKKEGKRSLQLGQSLGLMGIASVRGNDGLALAAASPAEAARVMRWDLVNPWSRFYELGSTHPLTAMRIRALNRESSLLRQEIAYPLPENARVRWQGFPIEFLFWAAPLVCGFVLFTLGWIGRPLRQLLPLPAHLAPWLLIALGATWAARIAFRYRGTFESARVEDLLEDMSVSQMRPRAVELTGEVLGHGVPGAFWSPDLVMRDETGMMFLLYRSSIPFGRLLFAIRSADRFVGETITVRGWYRRGLKPYVELTSIEGRVSKAQKSKGLTTLFGGEEGWAPLEYEQLKERSYSVWIQLAVAAGCAAVGVVWMLGSL